MRFSGISLVCLCATASEAFLAPIVTWTPLNQKSGKPTQLSMSIPNALDTLTSGLASICRLPGGVSVTTLAITAEDQKQRPVLKQLYDVENSRTCRLVREKITELDLVVEKVIPAAVNSRVFTDDSYAYALPPSTVVPRLVVTDSDGREKILSGDEEILNYLDQQFVSQPPAAVEDDPKDQLIRVLREIGSYVAGALRAGRGSKVAGAANTLAPRPSQPLILYSYEGNQFCRLVREVLTELDLVYELRSAGKGSFRRNELVEITGGSSQCPYLIDPNTGASMPESADIIRYLYKTYSLYTPPNEVLQWASDVILPAAKPIFQVLAPIQAGSKGEDQAAYEKQLQRAKSEIQQVIQENPIVVYSYDLSPFSTETKAVLNNLGVPFKDVSLGLEWIPGLIKEGGAITRAALLDMTGQSSLPHIFIGGQSIGGLFSGNPGLLEAIEDGTFRELLLKATTKATTTADILDIEDTEAFA